MENTVNSGESSQERSVYQTLSKGTTTMHPGRKKKKIPEEHRTKDSLYEYTIRKRLGFMTENHSENHICPDL